MTRFEEFRSVLLEHNYFKLVCGAGNNDSAWIEKLTFTYAMAGALGIDMAAEHQVVKMAVSGLERAKKYLQDKKRQKMAVRPFLTVSVGVPGDHHVRKAIINDKCTSCNLCIPACPTKAIPESLVVIDDLCIGCGACEAVCHFQSIEYSDVSKQLETLLPELLELGADNVELHAAVPDNVAFEKEWKAVCKVVPENYCSLSLDRNYLSNEALKERILLAKSIAGERTMIQADGVPMGGTSNDLGKTIQAVACGQQINMLFNHNKKLRVKDREVMVLLSGGTNANTKTLAMEAGVLFHGISIGTYARKVVNDCLEKNDFFENERLIERAVSAARNLVGASVMNNKNITSK